MSRSPNLEDNSLWQQYQSRLTVERKERMIRAASERTNFIHLVLQDVHQPHNVSACIRSAEAFGINNIHVVDIRKNNSKFKPSSVAKGVSKWVNIHIHSSFPECTQLLKSQGFAIAAGMPVKYGGQPLESLPIDRPIALVFGNEHEGIDPIWKDDCDFYFNIPTVGLVESLNISVSAAITLHTLSLRAKKEVHSDQYFLTEGEQTNLLSLWVERQFPREFNK